MIQNILIAAAIKPINGKTPEDIYNMISAGAAEYNCVVLGGEYAHGRGCINLGLKIQSHYEKDIDRFGRDVCMALMPAKWGGCADDIADGFIDRVS